MHSRIQYRQVVFFLKKSASTTHVVFGRETTVKFEGWIYKGEHEMLPSNTAGDEGKVEVEEGADGACF